MLKFDGEDFRAQIFSKIPLFADEVLADMALTVATAARNYAIFLAGERLGSQKDPFIRSLTEPALTNNGLGVTSAVLSLEPSDEDEALVMMLENGTPGFSIKDALLAGPEAAANGGYVDVPFRKGGPRSRVSPLGGRYGREDPTRQSARIREVGAAIATAMENKARMNKSPSQVGKVRIPMLQSHTGYKHKSQIFDGLQRLEKTKKSDPGFITWRRVSENSAGGSWMYPAKAGAHIMDDLEDRARDAAEKYLTDIMKGRKRVRRAAVSRAKKI